MKIIILVKYLYIYENSSQKKCPEILTITKCFIGKYMYFVSLININGRRSRALYKRTYRKKLLNQLLAIDLFQALL